MAEIPVFFHRFQVGTVSAAGTDVAFAYDPRWLGTAAAFPISVTMPLRAAPYDTAHIAPWLANLLPEEHQLDMLSRTLGVSAADTLALLSAIGGDTAGALSFGAPADPERWSYVPLTAFYDDPDPQRALARHFDDLEQRPFLAGEEGVRLSLAGGQKKTALAVLAPDGTPVLRLPREGDALAVPLNGAPSTVILKPDNPRLPGLTENETYCLHLATAIGIDTARACILSAQDRAAICVLRYDRALTAAGGIRRVHQEDFAQANGLPPGRKYERGSLPGLTLAQLFATRHRLAQPIGDALLDQVLFNILVANTDAHAKNYSLLFPLNALPGLAPLYDVSTVLPWDGRGGGPRVVQTYAQKLAGKARRPGDLAPRHWERIAGDAGMRAGVLRNRIVDMVDRMVAARIATTGTVAQMQGAASGYVAEAAEALEGNALRILGRLTAD